MQYFCSKLDGKMGYFEVKTGNKKELKIFYNLMITNEIIFYYSHLADSLGSNLGRFDEDGYLYILGRADDMVISGGLNVYPSEVETVLLNHPKVQEAAAVGIPDPKRGQVIKAIVVLKHGETATHREILSFCKERLASFKVPRQLEFKDSLPKSSIGKIVKRQL